MGNPIISPFDPNKTYGPAMSRVGRTPIQFRALPNEMNGLQQDSPGSLPSLISTLFSHPSLLGSQISKGSITIDPNAPEMKSDNDVQRVIRHEDIHSIVSKLGDASNQAAANSPYFSDIAKALISREGSPSVEAPAYVGSNDPEVKVDPLVKSAFWKGYVHHIQSLDPKTAKLLQSFGPGNVPQGFEAGPGD